MTRWFGGTLAALSVVALAGQAAAEKDRYEVGEAAPSFTLKAVNGDDVGETYISIDRYFGPNAKDPKKAVILSFFATYCEPCKREMPLLGALYETYKGKGLQVVLVSIDKDAEKIEEAKGLAKQNALKFPVLSDRFNIVAKRYFVSKLPNLYILNGEGKVAMVNVGYNDDVSKRLVDEVRKAIGEPTSNPIPEVIASHMAHAGSGPAVVPVEGDAETAVAQASDGKSSTTAKAEGNGNGNGKEEKRAKRKGRRGRRGKRK